MLHPNRGEGSSSPFKRRPLSASTHASKHLKRRTAVCNCAGFLRQSPARMSMTMEISTMNRSNREIHGLVPPPVVPHESAGSLHHSARPFKGYRHVSGVPFLKTTADAFAHQFKAKVAFTTQLQEDTSQYRANAGCLARRQGSDWVEICITRHPAN
jgi:hypothetical protein